MMNLNLNMKRVVLSALVALAFAPLVSSYEKPVTFKQLPQAAQTFITDYFPTDKLIIATQDDDLIRPDYEVRLASGTEIEFNHSGTLKKVSSKDGIPSGLLPEKIRVYVEENYPDVSFLEYEVDKRTYEVKLTNRLELTFTKNFILIEIDD